MSDGSEVGWGPKVETTLYPSAEVREKMFRAGDPYDGKPIHTSKVPLHLVPMGAAVEVLETHVDDDDTVLDWLVMWACCKSGSTDALASAYLATFAEQDVDPEPEDLWESFEAVARVMEQGNTREGRKPWDWPRKDTSWMEQFGAILRHLSAWSRGLVKDEQSGLLHIDHLRARILMLLHLVRYGIGVDDRP